MTPPLDLAELRRDIDAVDDQILKLLHERGGLVLKVGEYKRQQGVKAYDPDRERKLLARLGSAAQPPLNEGMVVRIFERIVDEFRRMEQHHME